MYEKVQSEDAINDFIFSIIETDEYKNIEYLVFSIRMHYLEYLSQLRLTQFEIPDYLEPLVDAVVERFNASKISTSDMLNYMLNNDINGWIFYYTYTFIEPATKGRIPEIVPSLNDLFALVLTGYILDLCRETKVDIRAISENEILLHETNQYGLSIVNSVQFNRDYFVFEDKVHSAAPNGSWCGGQRQLSAANGSPKSGRR